MQSRMIFAFNSLIVFGNGLYTLSLRNPHRKKSHGLRSGDRGGHIFLLTNFSLNLAVRHVCTVFVCVWCSTILLEKILFIICSIHMLFPKKIFDHGQVIVLVYVLCKEKRPINLCGRHRTPHQNFLIV